uniref:Uncharacterized protein n=1 Tax=Oryza brachyantha TaxID=4533 RepID=J3LLS8_ORYBR
MSHLKIAEGRQLGKMGHECMLLQLLRPSLLCSYIYLISAIFLSSFRVQTGDFDDKFYLTFSQRNKLFLFNIRLVHSVELNFYSLAGPFCLHEEQAIMINDLVRRI